MTGSSISGRNAEVAMCGIRTEGHTNLPGGYVAAIATFLEMRRPPADLSSNGRSDLKLHRSQRPDPDAYRDVFRRVGTDWLWNSRLRLSDEALMAVLSHPCVELYLPMRQGKVVGLLELDFRIPGESAIAFFGLVPEAIGQGAGRWMMNEALRLSWRDTINRVWLHTCTLDHPDALAFYLRSGFKPYARKLEMFPDPRLAGLLPRDAAPHVPIIEA
jgi:GNAT superfamily N-acetyltransferase